MKALVTGAAGFIGSHICDHLLEQGFEVVALDDLSGGLRKNVSKRAKWQRATILDHEYLRILFELEQFDYVFHLAAYAAEGLSPFIRRFNYQNNLIGSVNLINLAIKHKIKCFVFTSSIAVYGVNTVPMVEEAVPNPIDPYGIAKLAVEMDLKLAHEQFGLPYIIFRAHNVYGERQNIFDKYRNVIGIFMRQILQDEPMTIFGDGEQRRAFSYIDDVAPLMADSINVSDAYQQVFNIGGEIPYTINYLAEEVSRLMGTEYRVKRLAPRHEPKVAYASQEKLRKFFPNENSTSLERGLRKMAEWVLTIRHRRISKFRDLEILEGLPDGW